jgi:hypothetical protein
MTPQFNIRKFTINFLLDCLQSMFMMAVGTYAGHLAEVTEPLLIGIFAVLMVGFANILSRIDKLLEDRE